MRARLRWSRLLVVALAIATVGNATPGAHAAAPATPAAPVSALATPSKTDVSVGETFTVDVKAMGPAGSAFLFPPAAAQETFELRTALPDSTPLPQGVHRYLCKLFAVGEAQLPAIPVRYRLADGRTGEIATAPVPLHVVSLLPKEKSEQKLVDVRPPVRVTVGPAFWIGLSVAVFALAALAWWLVTRRRAVHAEPEAATPALEPDDEARRALDALIASGRLAAGEYRPFYIELSAIAKRYLERRLGAPILEMTSAEMLAYLRSSPPAADLAPTLRDLSGAADQIKFARGSGLNDEAERHMAAVRSLVAALEERLQPKPAPAPTPATPEGGQAA